MFLDSILLSFGFTYTLEWRTRMTSSVIIAWVYFRDAANFILNWLDRKYEVNYFWLKHYNVVIQNRTEQKFYLDLSITSSSSQQYIIYKTYILRMYLKCYCFDKCSSRVRQIKAFCPYFAANSCQYILGETVYKTIPPRLSHHRHLYISVYHRRAYCIYFLKCWIHKWKLPAGHLY